MRRRIITGALVFLLSIAGGACSGKNSTIKTAALDPDASAKPGTPTGSGQSSQGSGTSFQTSGSKAGIPAVGPSPLKFDWEPDTTIDARLSTDCIVPGQIMSLTVRMKPNSSVGFVAIYANNRSGGPPPWGAGYGGNEGAMIDQTGQHTFIWTVRADTPKGPARVDVIASVIGEGRAHSELPFSVQQFC